MKNLTIIGGGPAALMLCAEIDTNKYNVTLVEKKKTVGRKFLVAGEGGLNLTFNTSLEALVAKFSPSKFMSPILHQFSNEDFMQWLHKLGVETYTGSSNRVFPSDGLKPIEVLNQIVQRITTKKIKFQLETTWLGWKPDGHLSFDSVEEIESDIVVYALGGASWKITGSDGNWLEKFEARGVQVKPFQAANCAFEVDWDEEFASVHQGKPLKNIELIFNGCTSKGELTISNFGLEGNAIYPLSEYIQKSLQTENLTVIHLDLKPTMTVDQIKSKFNNSKKEKVTDILKNDLNLDRASIGLLKQFTDRETFSKSESLAEAIKSIPIRLHSSDEIDKAISTLGGISLNELDSNFQLKKIPNNYAIGEMLDWYAPTGGYLLQGCFSMGFVLAKHLNERHF